APRSPNQMQQRRRRGRRPGTTKAEVFQDFIFQLLNFVSTGGGKLSLEKNIEKGSLITAIDLLTPYLPDGFATKLSAQTLQRLKDSFREAEKDAVQYTE